MSRTLLTAVALWVSTGLAFGQGLQSQQRTQQTGAVVEKQTAKFETADGVKIEADYYPPQAGAEKAPVAMLVHMFPADRTSWKPLVPALREAGFAVLAYDIRGTGGSTEPAAKNLKKLYREQAPELFKDAWKDAEAARKWLATQPDCDAGRLVMIGASIGCSISLDYGSRDEAVKAIVCLSPGTDYFGVDSRKHIKACGKRQILLISPEGEYGAVEQLIKASDGVAKGEKYEGGHDRHGTKMFDAPYGEKVRKRMVDFVREAVSSKNVKPGAEEKDKKP